MSHEAVKRMKKNWTYLFSKVLLEVQRLSGLVISLLCSLLFVPLKQKPKKKIQDNVIFLYKRRMPSRSGGSKGSLAAHARLNE